MTDIIKVADAFNTAPGHELYDEDLDLNLDNAINLLDIMLVAAHFNKTADDYPEFK